MAAPPEISFNALVVSLATSAAVHFGDAADPSSGQHMPPNLEAAGHMLDLLVVLADHAQRVIARERLIELSRTRLGDSSDRSIDVLVSRLRRKLGSAGAPAPIVTVRGVGYMLNAPVERR